ncbi:MAG: twitching motility family protein [Rickettsiales bacterium]|jgi:twitching motility protein PilU|nr:twitching motility family protein [Rickettsiales bacterium]
MLPFMESLLTCMIEENGQDLYLTVGKPACIRVEDKIVPKSPKPLERKDIHLILEDILNEKQRHELADHFELNVALRFGEKERFRLNAFYQQQMPAIVIRRIQTYIPTIEALGLPRICQDLAMMKQGLVLVSGPSGAGKSTTLASMVGYRNVHGGGHILTIEDPIEYVHEHKNCIITQREVGMDTHSYTVALKNALRQRADVIVMGEMRDRESMEHGLHFAEAGHLCIATVHASNPVQTVTRIINRFPEEMRSRIQSSLAHLLHAVLYQRLVPGVHGKRMMASGLLLNQGAVTTLIEEGRLDKLKEVAEKGHERGMYTFDQSLVELCKAGQITQDTAIAEAESKADIRVKLQEAGILDRSRNTDGLSLEESTKRFNSP